MPTTPETNRARHGKALLYTAVLLALFTAVQTIFYLCGYEFESDLYRHGPFSTLTVALWIVGALGAVLINLLLPKKTTCFELKIRPTMWIDTASILATVALLSTLVLPVLFMNDGSDMLGNLLQSDNVNDATARLMLIGSLILAIPAAFHFIMSFAHHKTYPQSGAALLVWTAFSALRVYFDMRYLLTSPHRIMHLMALLSVLFFCIVELRQARGIASARVYGMGASLVIVLAGCDAICNLLLAAMGWFTLGSELATYLFMLAIALYAAARLHALATEKKEAAPAEPTESVDPTIPTEEEESDQ